jgi:hypothetical protein
LQPARLDAALITVSYGVVGEENGLGALRDAARSKRSLAAASGDKRTKRHAASLLARARCSFPG